MKSQKNGEINQQREIDLLKEERSFKRKLQGLNEQEDALADGQEVDTLSDIENGSDDDNNKEGSDETSNLYQANKQDADN